MQAIQWTKSKVNDDYLHVSDGWNFFFTEAHGIDRVGWAYLRFDDDQQWSLSDEHVKNTGEDESR